MMAPVLLVVGRPVILLLHSAGNPVHSWVKRVVRSRTVTALTWPPATVVLYCAVVAGTHLTSLMNLVVENDGVHDAEHALYLVTGYLFFLPVLGSEPIRWRVPMAGRYLMLLVSMPVDTAVGVLLMIAPHEMFPAYAHAGRTWGPSLLADLHAGGVIMWAGSDSIMTVLALAVAVLLIRDPRQARLLGRWAEGTRRTVLLQGMANAGMTMPGGPTIDDDAHLAAYNAYLGTLSVGHPRSTMPMPMVPESGARAADGCTARSGSAGRLGGDRGPAARTAPFARDRRAAASRCRPG